MKIVNSLIAIVASVGLAGCSLLSSPPEQKLDDLIVGVNYVGVSVDDVDVSADYYESAFAVEMAAEDALEDAMFPEGVLAPDLAQARSKLLRSSNAQLRLMSFDEQTNSSYQAVPVEGPGVMHVCFQAKKDTNIYANALAAGAEPIGAEELIQLSERNPVKYGYIKDSHGIITEIEEVDVAQLDLPEPPKNDYRMRHVAFATPDLEAMVQFYSAFLGGQEPRRIGNWLHLSGEKADKVSGLPGSEIEMAWFQLRNLEIEIAQYHSHPTERLTLPKPLDAPGYNMIVFDVVDLERARDRFIAAGGEIITGQGSLDGSSIIFGRDPDGNLLGLQKLPADSAYSAKNFDGNGT